MKKFLVIVALVLALTTVFCACSQAKPTEGEKSFTVTVVHADGSSKDFSYKTTELYVGTVLQAEGLIEGEEGEFGLYIHAVDGEQAIYEEDGAYWAFYVNGEYAAQGIDLTPIEDGTTYSLEYTVG
ncbi:MAG: DUF4430 domain-containing protein [Oscillospiraceae bacterium]|nr:DUF4430 domain-containing protein [Oscillospiraceae bacterium]